MPAKKPKEAAPARIVNVAIAKIRTDHAVSSSESRLITGVRGMPDGASFPPSIVLATPVFARQATAP
jgi:hypothetical protein